MYHILQLFTSIKSFESSCTKFLYKQKNVCRGVCKAKKKKKRNFNGILPIAVSFFLKSLIIERFVIFFRKGRWFWLSKGSRMFNYPSAISGLVYIRILSKLRLHISRCYLPRWLFHLLWQGIWWCIAIISLPFWTFFTSHFRLHLAFPFLNFH